MGSFQSRVEALAEHGRWLRGLGNPLFLVGVCLLIFGVMVVWPDQGATGTLARTKLLVPSDLALELREAGVAIYDRTVGFMEPADQATRLKFGLLPLGLWLLWQGAGFFIQSWIWRAAILFFGCPILLVFLSSVIEGSASVETVKVGHVSKYAGRALPPDDESGGRQQLAPVWKTVVPRYPPPHRSGLRGAEHSFGGGDRARSSTAYHLQPQALRSPMADQARFVLAQQAYHDARPKDVAVQLHALSGGWRPDHPLPQTIVGVLVDYARAHGFNVGEVAPQIAEGRPHQALRWGVTAWAIRLGTLLVIVGLALDLTGLFRQRAAKRLGAAARGTPDTLVAARASL